MAMLDKVKFKTAIDTMNADLAKSGKTLQEVADEQKTEALAKMKKLNDDPAYAKMFKNEK